MPAARWTAPTARWVCAYNGTTDGVVVTGQYQQRGVALVLQVVHQDRQLLAQIRELRHPGEL